RAPRTPAPSTTEVAGAVAHVPVRRLLAQVIAQPAGRSAVATLVSAQLVMILIMTMTPIHLRGGGHDLGTVGMVISAHTFGMFALSPLSGRAADRFGAPAVIVGGFGVLAAAGLLAAADPSSGRLMALPLFLLGVGWNLCFVAGSSLLASGAAYAERARVQGGVDSTVWTAGALSSIASGVILDLAGFRTLAIVGSVIAVVLAGAMVVGRGALERAVEPDIP
ncbi:MAG TPA: MFS transporter, partial [Candidatus Limnocylindria bacterium]|nr:MFS transporter [Candidatus Limnocylindria bacterium]